MGRRTDSIALAGVEVESSAVEETSVVQQRVDDIADAGFHVTPNISVEQTAQQLILDLNTHGAQNVFTPEQLEHLLSPVGQLSLKMWEINAHQNNFMTNTTIQANTQLANALTTRHELAAACPTDAKRNELASAMGTMMMHSCPQVFVDGLDPADWANQWTDQSRQPKRAKHGSSGITITGLKGVAKPFIDAWVQGGLTAEGRDLARSGIQMAVNESWGGYDNRAELIKCISKFLLSADKNPVGANVSWQTALGRFVTQMFAAATTKTKTKTKPKTTRPSAPAGPSRTSDIGDKEGKGLVGAKLANHFKAALLKLVFDSSCAAYSEHAMTVVCPTGRTDKCLSQALWLLENKIPVYNIPKTKGWFCKTKMAGSLLGNKSTPSFQIEILPAVTTMPRELSCAVGHSTSRSAMG